MLEQRFQEFRKKFTASEWDDVDLLKKQSEAIRAEDNELADRILVRARHLNKQAQKKAEAQNKAKVQTQTIAEVKAEPAKPSIEQTQTTVDAKLDTKVNTLPEPPKNWLSKVIQFILRPFVLFVVLPSLIFAFYQLVWATERYESNAQVIVQQPDSAATMDASLALLSGLGVSPTSGSDPQLLSSFINSSDMLAYLDEELDLRGHYSHQSVDFFSRLPADATNEELLEFYQNHITVEIDERSSVISVSGQGFDADFAQQLTTKIVSRAEWFINNIGHQLAEAQLTFIKGEHQMDEDRLKKTQTDLLGFQQRYQLLDPTAEGAAMQQIAYTIEGQIASKEAEFKGLTSVMSEQAPQVQALQNELSALREQLTQERNKLSKDTGGEIPVSEILSRYTDLKITMELALQSYTSSKVSLEKSRIEAYRQLKYLVTVQQPVVPGKSTYPDAFYNISLFILLSAMLFAIGRIVLSVINELK